MKQHISRALCLLIVIMMITLTSCKKNDPPEPADPATSDSVSATQDESIAPAPSESTGSVDSTAQAPAASQADSTAITYTAPTQAADSMSAQEVLSLGSSDPNNSYDASGFVNIKDVIPEAQTEIRYATSHNFVGEKINGYEEEVALMTKEAAAALIGANNDLKEQGYTVKIFICLCGKTYPEVQFYGIPPQFECLPGGTEDILFSDSFVDDIPQSLCPRFGSEGKT